ncbi:hypothetical protein [Streptomyces albus]|uniref:hypothetical protein n=1 Tax=Streptomyces sp. NRRL F-5917 TaxID=1463873 RepID=UPI0004C10387|nr:hypothetical protein [Streptomyces sp. NRRL F-5917]
MSDICTTTTVAGRPCQAPAIRWPYGSDGNPRLCAKHAPAHLREMRDALFAEEARRHAAKLAARLNTEEEEK